ncbi:MAG: heterodisulfide reductase-related iron-sulfur binding cluster, partial [Mycobacteriales bacterium]
MTIPVEALLAKKATFERDPERYPDFKAELARLEGDGEFIVQKITGEAVAVPTRYGRDKLIPKANLWHHKSCGQCGHIPGYSTSIFWIMRKLGYDYIDPRDQTSCTAWNYYASATSNAAAQACVAVRNFAAAYETGYFPLIHCGTSYGHYKEVRHELMAHPKLRAEVRGVMEKLGKPLVLPEEIVHYSEWLYALRHEIAALQVRDASKIAVTVHPACHYYKLVEGDAIYDPDDYGGQRTAVVTGLAEALGAEVRNYSTWFDCCGFGFRHILVQRDFTRSFATLRKIERMKEEANPDVVLTHDTGCVTTLDKSQFAAQAHDRNV